MKRHVLLVGILLFVLLLAIHLLTIDDYGLTWDFHHHFFAGLSLLGRTIEPYAKGIQFVAPDPRLTTKLPFGPLMSIAPVTTYIIFFEKLKLLAFDNAYNLSIITTGIAGIVILYFLLSEAINQKTALVAAILLALLPRYFGDLHNNMKDVPQAAAFTLAIWMFWRLVQYRKPTDVLLAASFFAIAFNTKVNTLAVPLVAFLWMLLLLSTHIGNLLPKPLTWSRKGLLPIILYFPLAAIAAFALWSFFWPNPIGQLLYIYRFFQDNTKNIEVLYFGKWYCSGINVPWHYPLGYLAITTPLPVVFFFLIGLISQIRQIRSKPIASLLLLWFFVPLTRYVFPQMGVIDGIRHFEEVVFPLAAIAAVGAIAVSHWVKQWLSPKIITVIIFIIFIILIKDIVLYHPYQITYFNELVGGSRGAMGNFDIDYWGSSQKAAMRWLNKHAKPNSRVHVVMASDVATHYLRADLQERANTVYYDNSDYVVVLNRLGFFYRFVAVDYILTHKPIHVITGNGVPLVWIYDNSLPKTARQKEWWSGRDPCIRY